MDENEQDLNARILAMAADGEIQPTVSTVQRTDYLSGAFQNALALGTTYLSRRMDVDIQSRIAGSMPQVTRPSNQRPIADHADLTTRAVASAGGMRIGDIMPFAVVGLVAWLLLGKRG